jgi:hypothetical protein
LPISGKPEIGGNIQTAAAFYTIRVIGASLLSCAGSQPTLGRLRKLACPRIHDEVRHTPTVLMDCRVKPGNDN